MSDLHVIVEADGGSRGNPGPAGYGAVVREAATGEVLLERYASLGTTTNNVAEYSGLIAGLRAAAEINATHVDVRMDSKLVVEQMSGRWQIKNPGLRPLAAEAATLVARFAAVTFDWIPRERNKAADALANQAMDEAAGKPVRDVIEAAPEPRTEAGAELGAAVAGRRHPADPGPARRDRDDQAGPLLRAGRRAAVRRGPGPGDGGRRAGGRHLAATSRPSSRHR